MFCSPAVRVAGVCFLNEDLVSLVLHCVCVGMFILLLCRLNVGPILFTARFFVCAMCVLRGQVASHWTEERERSRHFESRIRSRLTVNLCSLVIYFLFS